MARSDWTAEELAALTCQAPGCTLLITLNSHYCDHHAEQLRQIRARRPARRAGTVRPLEVPLVPTRLCLESRCGNPATARGRCDEHRKAQERERSRVRRAEGVERNRFYARKHWRMVRKAKLFANPLCELEHEGICTQIAEEVHHRVAMEDGGAEYDLTNLVSTCKPCHSRETRREMLERRRAE